ncbi:tRNA modification GTPase MnmE [Agaricicola taiwanensis]|uniref:tRNA modification GTPase MnmE n=2 Tax=Agaricicola taiwanensis TaxID=591372 RepID=A0A8J2VKD8_9RHOB|nr:tRNA modification GTPase MnmE [Agaricicola taiwanensis]
MAVYTELSDPNTGDLLDKSIALLFRAPASFTGEDVAELHVHGGHAVIDGVLKALGRQPGLRPADPGEFSRRAFLNGKLDLSEAEALADLIDAETVMQRRQALRGMDQGIGRLAEEWRDRLIDVRALAEATIDFIDEGDVPDEVMDDIREGLGALRHELASTLDDGQRGERLRDGFAVVIAGPPNAGKSTLLNLLAKREAAIVSAYAGTTRDAIDVHLDLEGYPVLLTDTAGIRTSDDPVEREGINRAVTRARHADLVLWLSEDGAEPDIGADVPVWRIRTKADGGRETNDQELVAVSAVTGLGINELIARLVAEAAEQLSAGTGPAITRARHRYALEGALAAVDRSLSHPAVELLAEELRIASHELGRISGHTDPEHVLDAIFSRFCIGK